MSPEAWIALAILALGVVLFFTERLSVDLVALVLLLLLLVTGLVTPSEGLAGFGSEATAAVAAMFVLSAGLQRTGSLRVVAQAIERHGTTPARMTLLVMAFAATASAFVNNTAIVAIFLPPVLVAAGRRKVAPTRLLIPLSYASQMGGVCTLVGTSTNLLVHAEARRFGLDGFGMFELAPLGVAAAAVGFAYVLLAGRWLLPDRPTEPFTESYRLSKYMAELSVREDSRLVGRSVEEARLGEEGVFVLELLRRDERVWSPRSQELQPGDVLLVRGDLEHIERVREREHLDFEPELRLQDDSLRDKRQALVEALVVPGSHFVGHTVGELDFRGRVHAIVLGIHRRGEVVRDSLRSLRLLPGDVLLLHISAREARRLARSPDLLVLTESEDPRPPRRRAPLALAIVAAVVATAALGLAPVYVAALGGALAMALGGCLRAEELYEAIDWRVVVMLAALLPLGQALEDTGAAGAIARATLGLFEDGGPTLALLAVYLLTAVLTELMSNNATAVLLTPVAVAAARALGVDPAPFLVAVAFAASTSFATPIGYQTNTMVYNAGSYRFADFLRVGVPLNLLFAGLATLLIPWLWPFVPTA